MIKNTFVSITIKTNELAAKAAQIAVTNSLEFHVTPLPYDSYEIQVKPEAKYLFKDLKL